MMKKRILACCLLMASGCAATFNTIEQTAIDKARTHIERELVTAHKKRGVVAGLGITALLLGAYGTYKTWQDAGEHIKVLARSMGTDSSDVSDASLGFFARTRKWVGKQAGAAVDVGPALIISSLVGNTVSIGMEKMFGCAAYFYRPLGWQWMMRERAPFEPLVCELKNCAAVLDPVSELFSLLTQVKINWEGPCSVMTADGWIQVSAFDELVKLRMLAQTTPADTRAMYEQHVEQIWNNLIERMVQCLGFIAYKQQAVTEGDFDAHLLATMSAHLIASTNALAKQMPALMNAQNKQQSSGLLVAVYRYSTDLLHCCELLTSNNIVAG